MNREQPSADTRHGEPESREAGAEPPARPPGPGMGRLRTPSLAVARHPRARIDTGDLEAWIARLPYADPQQLARDLLEQLSLLVRYPVPLPRLHQALALFGPPLAQLEGLVRRDAGRLDHLPIGRRWQQLYTLFGSLQRELANGYKRVINERLERREPARPEELKAGGRALGLEILLELARYHTTPPEGWRDLLELYRLAESQLPSESGAGGAAELRAIFLTTLLLQLSDPYRQRPAALWRLAELLPARLAGLTLTDQSGCPGGIPVDMSGLVPPLRRARQRRLPSRGPTRCLLTADFQTRLATAGEPPDTEDARHLAALSAALDDLLAARREEARTAPRRQRRASYLAFTGLEPVHDRLRELLGPAGGTTPQEIDLQQWPAGPARPAGIPCQQFDHSRRGAGFFIEGRHAVHICVGDILLFQSQPARGRAATGFVALVRRLLLRDDGRVEMGVERLQGRLTPVGLQRPGSTILLRALLRRRDDAGLDLFAPRGTYGEGQTLQLQTATSQLEVQARGMVLQPNGVERIQVAPL